MWLTSINIILACFLFLKLQECQEALGVENGAILDGQISASTEYNAEYSASYARLNLQASSGNEGSWSPRTPDVSQWLQVTLGKHSTKVTRIATQGNNKYKEWVFKYKLQYSDDGENFQYYKEQGQKTDKVG